MLLRKIGLWIAIAGATACAQYPASFRVCTYNINAEKHADGSYSDIATVLTALNPAIAGLQKVDSCNSRNPAFVLEELGTLTQRTTAFTPAIKNFQESTGSYGVGMLMLHQPLSSRQLWLPHTANEQDRGALEISITMEDEPVRVIVTHLAHEGPSYRVAQTATILNWIDSTGTADPVVIMADFNATPDAESMTMLKAAGFGYVTGKNGAILDTTNGGINHILFRPLSRWRLDDAANPRYEASNRNPVWADLTLMPSLVRTLPRIPHRVLQHVDAITNFYSGSKQFTLSGRVLSSAVAQNSFTRNHAWVGNPHHAAGIIIFESGEWVKQTAANTH